MSPNANNGTTCCINTSTSHPHIVSIKHNVIEHVNGSDEPPPPIVSTKPTLVSSNDPTLPVNCTTGPRTDSQPMACPLISTAPNANADKLSRIDRNTAVPANAPVVIITPPTPVNAIHVSPNKPTSTYNKPLVPAVRALKEGLMLANVNVQLTLMELNWRKTCAKLFPSAIWEMFAQLREAIEV